MCQSCPNQLSDSSSSASRCCRASVGDDDWWGWGELEAEAATRTDLARLMQALRVENPLADSPGGQLIPGDPVLCEVQYETSHSFPSLEKRGQSSRNWKRWGWYLLQRLVLWRSLRLLWGPTWTKERKKKTFSAVVCNAPVQHKCHLTCDSFVVVHSQSVLCRLPLAEFSYAST